MRVANISFEEAISDIDLFVFGLGYEPRCTFIAESASRFTKENSVAIGYSYSKIFGYEEAARKFSELGVSVIDGVSDDAFPKTVRSILTQHPNAKSVFVDISALNRARMAACVDVLIGSDQVRELKVYFGYAGGRFVSPPVEVVQNESIGPIGASFSGILSTPELPSETVVGLGYEMGKALGAVEYLQSNDLWLFVPTSSDPRFEEEVLNVNGLLLEQVEPERVIRYRVEDPAGTYVDLRSLLHGMVGRSNPMLLPLGPKIFALTCLIVAVGDKTISVWRASQGQFEVPIAREANGSITTLLVCKN